MSRWAGAAGLGGILITGQWRGPACAPCGPGAGGLHTFWLPVDAKAASLRAEGVNLGTGVCRGLQNSSKGSSKPQRILGAGTRVKAGLCPWTRDDRRCPWVLRQLLLVLRLFDAGHSQRQLMSTRLCLTVYHPWVPRN